MDLLNMYAVKVKPTKAFILKVFALYSIGIAIAVTAMLLKIVFFTKSNFNNPALSFLVLAAGLVLLMFAYFFYTINSRDELISSPKSLYAITSAMVITYIACIYFSLINVLLMPIFLTAFIVAPLSKRRDAFSSNIFANILVLYTLLTEHYFGANVSFEGLSVMCMIGISAGTAAAYGVAGNAKRTSYLIKGLILGMAAFLFIILFDYISPSANNSLNDVLVFASVAAFSPVILGLVLQPIFESIFNLVTNYRLVELTDHNSPLIKRLRTETPGTFNHSLAVANFAEICASAIGENPYLARACAYYHDVGKLTNATYFKENQGETNPHDELLPEVSADIIRSHTTEGYKLCKEYRIPYDVAHVTVQHHGTLLIPVFYNKAKQLTDSTVDADEYCYHGVTPITKVAAIIMLCDSGEAAIRAMVDPDGEKVDQLLTSLINSRIQAGQFDNCDISLRDLDEIKKAIISAYGGLFHKRMQYPDGDKRKS